MNIETKRIFSPDDSLFEFMNECEKLGYANNTSLKALKFDWIEETGGSWWGTYDSNRLIAISAIHPFLDGWRALHRGAQIQLRPFNGLNKYQKQNYGIYDHLHMQIQWSGMFKDYDNEPKPIYITTSIESADDRSGKMNRIHRSASILAAQGMFEHVLDDIIYGVNQSIWKVNVDRYYEIRNLSES